MARHRRPPQPIHRKIHRALTAGRAGNADRVTAGQARSATTRLTLGVAATTVTAVAGITAGVAFASTPTARSGSEASATVLHSSAAGITGGAATTPKGGHPDAGSRTDGNGQLTRVAQRGQASHRQDQHASARQQPGKKTDPAKHSAPYLIYDSLIPWAIPSGHEIATYATGAHPITPAQVAGRGHVLWIDTLGTDPQVPVLDVEPGCASPAAAAGWVSRRLTAHPSAVAIIYTSISQWSTLQADVATLPTQMRSHVRWWIADPTGVPHLVPGSDATQWYWGSSYDISTATPRLEGLRPACVLLT